MASAEGLVVARTSFYSGKLLVRAGEVWVGDDPVVSHYPAAFRPLEVRQTTPPVVEHLAGRRRGGRVARSA